jgi:hypothetical protein
LKAAILKANKAMAKKKKGNSTKPPNSILWKKSKLVALNQMPKKKSMSKKKSANSDMPAQGANSNFTVRDNKRRSQRSIMSHSMGARMGSAPTRANRPNS